MPEPYLVLQVLYSYFLTLYIWIIRGRISSVFEVRIELGITLFGLGIGFFGHI